MDKSHAMVVGKEATKHSVALLFTNTDVVIQLWTYELSPPNQPPRADQQQYLTSSEQSLQ